MKTQEQIQIESVEALIENNGGTVQILTGGGKSKIAIDFLMKTAKPGDTVLITIPLIKLEKNWVDEFVKWTQFFSQDSERLYVSVPNGHIIVYLQTIQTAYKWKDKSFTYLIVDEVHTTVTSEYSAIFDNINYKYCVGLTATTDVLRREDKQLLYDKHCPVVYSYLDGEKDGVVNKTQFKIIEHTLNDTFKVKAGAKGKQWNVGEKSQYEYLSKQIKLGQQLMAIEGSSNFFSDASEWFWKKKGTKSQADAARKYLGSITSRRKFLLSLQSSSEIAKRLAKRIILKNETNKVLVFSEQVEQLKKICKYNVYGDQKEELNTEILTAFNDGDIRALGSCYTLTLGMNLKNVNNAILESYNGSDTKATQRIGRLHRLSTDQIATIYIIKILNTQSAEWCNSMLQGYDLTDAEIIDSSLILT